MDNVNSIREFYSSGAKRAILPYEKMAAIATPGLAVKEVTDYVTPLFGNDPVLQYCRFVPMPEGGRTFPRILTPATVATEKYDDFDRSKLADAVFDGYSPTPHMLAARARITKAILLQDDGTAEALIQESVMRSIRDGLVYQLLRGSGTNESASPPVYEANGLFLDTNLVHQTYTSSNDFKDDILLPGIRKLIEAHIDIRKLVFILSPSAYTYNLSIRRKTLPAENTIEQGKLYGTWPVHPTVHLPDYYTSATPPVLEDEGGTMIFGDWEYAIIVIFGTGMELVLNEVTNTSEVEILATVIYDVAPTDPKAFVVIERA